jgi:transposase-like protein
MGWFQDLIEGEITSRGGNVSQLSRDWDIDRTVIDKWRNGSEPKLPLMERVVKLSGGDLSRAMPDWRPSGDTPDTKELELLRSEVNLLRQRLYKIAEIAGPVPAMEKPAPKATPRKRQQAPQASASMFRDDQPPIPPDESEVKV